MRYLLVGLLMLLRRNRSHEPVEPEPVPEPYLPEMDDFGPAYWDNDPYGEDYGANSIFGMG